MMSHRQARDVVRAAFKQACGADFEPHPAAVMAIQTLALHETGYGSSWKGAGVGSRNWGASTGTGNAGHFEYRDSDVTGKQYVARFGRFVTDVDGAAWVVRWFRARPRCWESLETGNAYAVAEAMHDPNVSLAEEATDDVKARWGLGYFSGNAPAALLAMPDGEMKMIAIRKYVVGKYADVIANGSATIAAATGDDVWITRHGPLGPVPGTE